LQVEFPVEAEKIRSADCFIGMGHLLGCVVEIGEGEVVLFGEVFHVVKIVGGIAHRIIRADGDGGDANVLKFDGIAHQPSNHSFHIGAMIANEGYERAIGTTKALQRMNLAINTGQAETWCLPAEIA
jgi:hypothetical protein